MFICLPIWCLIVLMCALLFFMYDAGVLFVFLSVMCLSSPSAVRINLNLFCDVCSVFCRCCLSFLSVLSFVLVVGVGGDVGDSSRGTWRSSTCGSGVCGGLVC